MKKIQINKIMQTIKIILLALIIAAGIHYVNAAGSWTPAPANPPASNVDAPINAGASIQEKTGALHINTTSGATYGLVVFGKSLLYNFLQINGGFQVETGTGKGVADDFCLNPGTDTTKCLSYVLPGGPGAAPVTKIINGGGITINPVNGVGNVNIGLNIWQGQGLFSKIVGSNNDENTGTVRTECPTGSYMSGIVTANYTTPAGSNDYEVRGITCKSLTP